jgi:outer membrane protein TolC
MKMHLIITALALPLAAIAQDSLSPDLNETPGSDRADEMGEAIRSFGEQFRQGESGEAGEEGIRISVRQAVRMTLEQNPRGFVAEDEAAAARARAGQARSQVYPQIKYQVNSSYSDRFDDSTAFSGGGLGSGLGGAGSSLGSGLSTMKGTVANRGLTALAGGRILSSLASQAAQRRAIDDLLPDDNIITQTFSVDQVLYAGGRIRAAIAVADHLANSEDWKRAATLDELEFLTKQSYYDCILAQALVRVAEESVKTFERNVRDTEQMFEVGKVSSFETLRSRTELGSRQSDLIAAQNALRLSLANLRRLVGVPQSTAIQLEAQMDWLPYVAPLADLVEEANAYRPEIRALTQGLAAARQDLRRVRGTYAPSIGARAEYQTTDGAPTVSDGWLLSIAAEWEIAAGGRRKHERAESNANISRIEHQLDDLQQLIELEVTQARIQIEDATAKTLSQQGNVELAKEGLRLSELRFQVGAGTQSETLDAELALTSAESSLVQALRDFAVANAALERATGDSWFRNREETALTITED